MTIMRTFERSLLETVRHRPVRVNVTSLAPELLPAFSDSSSAAARRSAEVLESDSAGRTAEVVMGLPSAPVPTVVAARAAAASAGLMGVPVDVSLVDTEGDDGEALERRLVVMT
jgi:hypothetical protein